MYGNILQLLTISYTFNYSILFYSHLIAIFTYVCYIGISKEFKVFREYSDRLANILPVNNIINELISANIISFDDSEEIKSLSREKDKALFVLNKVAKSLKVDVTDDFYSLLRIMEDYPGTVAKVANKIILEL